MFKFPQSKKGEGNITALVFGIATLIVGIIIAFVVVSTLTDANLLEAGEVTTAVINETGASLDASGYTLDESAGNRHSYTITAIWVNVSGDYDEEIPVTNSTVGGDGIVYSFNVSASVVNETSYSYTYVTYTNEQFASDNLASNFTAGIDNVSEKIPTVLLVAAIVLILSVLVLLVGAWQRMRVSGGSI